MVRPALINFIGTREEFEKHTTVLFDLLGTGKLKIKIHETYPLAEIQRAHSDLEGRKTTGKLLLKP
jgi:NADPH2:quinone reductase